MASVAWRKGSANAEPIAYYENGMIKIDAEDAESYTMTISYSSADPGSSNLTIKEVKVDDIGTYYCTVSAGYIEEVKSIDVNVIGKIASYSVKNHDRFWYEIDFLFFFSKNK